MLSSDDNINKIEDGWLEEAERQTAYWINLKSSYTGCRGYCSYQVCEVIVPSHSSVYFVAKPAEGPDRQRRCAESSELTSADVAHANQPQTETVIRFTISQDGTLSAMELVESAHVIEVDRAAWGSIVGVGKFPALPAEFNGPNLVLRVGFGVNPPQQ